MGLLAKDKGGGKGFDPVPEGVHNAVCSSVVDLGTHYDEKFNKSNHSVHITWEIPGERIEIEREGVKMDLPRVISRKYTLSLNEKANLRKDLQTWRGKVFTESELLGFDIEKLLGKSCMIQVIHNKSGEKTYANISAIMPLMKGVTPLTPENPIQFYSIMDHRDNIPKAIPEWLVKIIEESEEWQMFNSSRPPVDSPPEEEDVPFGNGNDDVPF